MNRNRQAGFTIVELLVTMVLISAVMALSFYAYNRFVSKVRSGATAVEAGLDRAVGLELLRLDIEHAGFGIASDEPCAPVRWTDTSDACDNVTGESLILRSTINSSQPDTFGWVTVSCASGDDWTDHIVMDARRNTSVSDIVFIDYRGRWAFTKDASDLSCPRDGLYTGYPVDTSISNGCTTGVCARLIYALSQTQDLERCEPHTRNLLRKVGGGSGSPVLNCVADWTVRFALDTDEDGVVDIPSDDGTNLPSSPADLRAELKGISVYVLVQEGMYDSSYTFSGNTTVDGVTLTFPAGCTECNHYHWRVIKLFQRTMNL